MMAPYIRVAGGSGSPGRNVCREFKTAGHPPVNKTRNILVTGGAGYIGSHTCKALAEAGFCPVVLDNLVTGHQWAVKWGPFIDGDLHDYELLVDVLEEFEISAVVHFAAYAYVGESMQSPGKYFRNNVSNTITLLDAMVYAGVEQLVYSSSCATYGVPVELPINETHSQRPINPYGESKLFVERAVHWYGMAHGIRSYALRYFNAAGDDPDGEIGEDHDPETHLIPLVVQTALRQREKIMIYGTDYDTPDGTAIRDYVHVRDLADAHVKAVEQLMGGSRSRYLNLGTGTGLSVRDIIASVERLSGCPVNAVEAPRRPGDPPMLIAAPDAAVKALGWEPRYSDLETLVSTALNWHAKQAGTEPSVIRSHRETATKENV